MGASRQASRMTADGLRIWCVELDKGRAEEIARTCRETGRRARVAQRVVRAFGAETFGYVVLASDVRKGEG